MTGPARRALVVGAGVVGLTTAHELAGAGWDVRVVSREPPAATTSAVAAAFWYPYLVGPADAVARWGAATAERLAVLAAAPEVPVRARTVHELLATPTPDPGWRTGLPDCAPEEQLPAWAADGWRWTSWVADMPRYLPWLLAACTARGVTLAQQEVRRLDELPRRPGELLVDCAGVGARELAGDHTVEPVAGQVAVVDAPAVQDVWLAPDHGEEPTYVVPRGDTVVCGGTARRGQADRTPDPATTAQLLARCVALVPALADAPLLGTAVGLRPARPQVRLELERTPHGPVLHHYGHGGAGVTLSWGSAAAAAALAAAVLPG